MHTLILINKNDYKDSMYALVSVLAKDHSKACYISFNDPYHVVVDLLEDANVHHKYIVVDASTTTPAEEIKALSKDAYIVPVESLFDIYVFLANLIQKENVSMLLLDSLSTLIEKHGALPLKEMLMNMLLQIGAMRCSTNLVAYNHHEQHEVVSHLSPLIRQSIRM